MGRSRSLKRLGAADSLLKPDEVTFSIMVRGYGVCSPPRWSAISTLLRDMDAKYELKPSTGMQILSLAPCIHQSA